MKFCGQYKMNHFQWRKLDWLEREPGDLLASLPQSSGVKNDWS
jgi:hypothetical protein